MLTLKELLLEVNTLDHFRVYSPNRDCLIYESFLFPHMNPSVLSLDQSAPLKRIYVNRALRNDSKNIDPELCELLSDYGDCKVYSLECSSCAVRGYDYNPVLENLTLIKATDNMQPELDYVSCLDIFICNE